MVTLTGLEAELLVPGDRGLEPSSHATSGKSLSLKGFSVPIYKTGAKDPKDIFQVPSSAGMHRSEERSHGPAGAPTPPQGS